VEDYIDDHHDVLLIGVWIARKKPFNKLGFRHGRSRVKAR
jgi:hypothetical protein